jgi:hypothetical protein
MFVLTGPTVEGTTIFLENLDTTNYVTFQVQTANSNTSGAWSDLVADSPSGVNGNFNTEGILSPASSGSTNNQAMISIRAAASYYQVIASSSGSALVNYGIATIAPNTSVNFTNGTL